MFAARMYVRFFRARAERENGRVQDDRIHLLACYTCLPSAAEWADEYRIKIPQDCCENLQPLYVYTYL